MNRIPLLAMFAAVGVLGSGCVMVSPRYGHSRQPVVVSGSSAQPEQQEHPHGMPPGQKKKDCSHGHSKWCEDRD